MENHTRTLSEAFADRGQTLPSTCSSRPSETYRPKPNAKVREMISRLGLRFRPTNQADLQAHAAMLALLAEDVADVPADLLQLAIQRHVSSSPFMPKAADLIRIAKEIDAAARVAPLPRTGRSYAHDLAAQRNSLRTRDDVEWYVDHTGAVRLGDISSGEMRIHQQTWQPKPGEIDVINAKVAEAIAMGVEEDEFRILVRQGRMG